MRASENAVKQQGWLLRWSAASNPQQTQIWRFRTKVSSARHLLMPKSRRALLDKCRHSFFLVSSREQRVKEPPLE